MDYTVKFLPDNKEIKVSEGTSILDAAGDCDIQIKSSCGGVGSCGNCKVEVSGETVLACQTFVNGDMEVTVPQQSRLSEHKVLVDEQEGILDLLGDFNFNPIVKNLKITISEPTLEDNTSDLTMLVREIKKELNLRNINCSDIMFNLANMSHIGQLLRDNDWKVTITLFMLGSLLEMVNIEGGHHEDPPYGIALDIGTTTLAVYLIDLVDGKVVDRAGTYNKQSQYGDDVISRIIHTDEEEQGLKQLQTVVVKSVNSLTREMLKRNSLDSKDVAVIVAAGNTTMTQLFLGISPKYLRLEPYIPAATNFPPIKAKDLGLAINPEGYLLMCPSVASYVGGDIVSGVLYTGIHKKEDLVLFIDIGTNGEMVLGNQDWLVTCACSAGPSFEGGGITYGMRAMSGAIEKVKIDPDTLDVALSVVGNTPPVGICGSGLIDLMAQMRLAGIIDRTGKFNSINNKRIEEVDGEPRYILSYAVESGNGQDVYITESDIKNLIRSKGAVYAGIQSMLKMVELTGDAIEAVIIAGGFGNYLNVEDAVQIGLLPDMDRDKYSFVGNSSIKGAHLSLLSQEAYRFMSELAGKMTYIELSVGNIFMDEYSAALFLPHTDLSLFPSVAD